MCYQDGRHTGQPTHLHVRQLHVNGGSPRIPSCAQSPYVSYNGFLLVLALMLMLLMPPSLSLRWRRTGVTGLMQDCISGVLDWHLLQSLG